MKKVYVIVGSVVAAFAVVLVILYYLASRNYDRYTQEFRDISSHIVSVRLTILEFGRVKPQIRFEDLTTYVSAYRKARTDLVRIQNELKAGNGMAFWFPDAREQSTILIGSFVACEDSFLLQSESAINALGPVHSEWEQLLARSLGERAKATSVLNPQSDSPDFRSQSQELSTVLPALAGLRSRVSDMKKQGALSGMAEELRLGVLNHMDHVIASEYESGSLQGKALLLADQRLGKHKADVRRFLASQSGIVVAANSICREFMPVTSLVNERVQPLRNMIAQLEKPLFAANPLGKLGSLFGMSSSGSLSAMSLITSVDPATGHMVGSIKGVCDGIASANSEVAGIMQATQPFLEASRDFQSTLSRNHMRSVLQTIPALSEYFQSRRGIFDPITTQLDEGRSSISRLSAAASQIRIPGARDLVLRVANAANGIISSAYGPFHRWQQTVATVTDSRNQLDALEKSYVAALDELRSGK